jgi:hypothetical protein
MTGTYSEHEAERKMLFWIIPKRRMVPRTCQQDFAVIPAADETRLQMKYNFIQLKIAYKLALSLKGRLPTRPALPPVRVCTLRAQ